MAEEKRERSYKVKNIRKYMKSSNENGMGGKGEVEKCNKLRLIADEKKGRITIMELAIFFGILIAQREY